MIRNYFLIKTSRSKLRTRYVILYKYRQCGRPRAISSHNTSYSKIANVLTDKLTSVTKQFDSVLGISEVRSAQSLVQTAEDEFMKSRRRVQETRTELVRLQSELRDLRSKLDRIPREDERYLQLATEEHKALIAERKAKTDLETLETLERDHFSALSAAVRAAHEEERSRAERTKYWSIIASACGAVLGILGSTMINMKRMKQIRITVQENNEAFIAKTMEELRTLNETEQPKITGSEVAKAHSQLSNDFLALLNENSKVLRTIDAKVEKFSNDEILASKVKELVVSCNENEQTSNMDNSSSFVELDRHTQKLIWWSKASVIVSVTSSACLMFYMFSK